MFGYVIGDTLYHIYQTSNGYRAVKTMCEHVAEAKTIEELIDTLEQMVVEPNVVERGNAILDNTFGKRESA